MNFSPVLISLKTATVSIAVTFFLGLLAAQFTADLKRKEWKMILDGLFTLPMVLPPTVAGFFLLHIFGVRGPVGKFFLDVFSIRIAFSWGATALASVVISFPLMYRTARGAFEQMDQNLIYAARTLGLRETQIFFRIKFPACLPGIASGGVLAFARGLGEFGATAMIAGNIAGKTRTLPLAVYSAVAAGDMETSYGYVGVIMVISLIAVGLINYFTVPRQPRYKLGRKK